ncbi:flagellar brake protein [Ruminiclostridium hungatei]|nr:flagellar brake protein [Ruminiclostridium hungatei]
MNTVYNLKEFSIGTKIEMTVVDPVEGKLDMGFISQLEGLVDVNTIRISAPIHEAKVYPVRVNSHIEAYFFYKANQIYRVIGYVTDRLIIDDIALLDVRVTEKPEKIQRRQYYRFDCRVPVSFSPQKSDEPGKHDEIAGYTIDISGGGVSSQTDYMLVPNSVISGALLFDNFQLKFKGKVIRCSREIINEEIKYNSSISFEDIEYKEREKIVGFIFRQQRELLKKGLRGS